MTNTKLSTIALSILAISGCGSDSDNSSPSTAAPVINSIIFDGGMYIGESVNITVNVSDKDTALDKLKITYSSGSAQVPLTVEQQEIFITVSDGTFQTKDSVLIPNGVPTYDPYENIEDKVDIFNQVTASLDVPIEIEQSDDTYILTSSDDSIEPVDLSSLDEKGVEDLVNDIYEVANDLSAIVDPRPGEPITAPVIHSIELDGGIYLGETVFINVEAEDKDGDDLTITYNGESSNQFSVLREAQLVKVDVTDGNYLISQSIEIPKAADEAFIPTPVTPQPDPIYPPVIESVTQTGGIYVGDIVELNTEVTDKDTDAEDITISYSTGTNLIPRTAEAQIITVSVMDGTYLIQQEITIAAGSPVACDSVDAEGNPIDVCLPVGDIPEPNDRLIDPIEGTPVTIPVIDSITLDQDKIYLGDTGEIHVEVTDEDGDTLTITYNGETSNSYTISRKEQSVVVEVTDGTYLVSQTVTIPKAQDDAFIPLPISPTEPVEQAPVIEAIEKTSEGTYVGDFVILTPVVSDQDTDLEDLTITYSTESGSNIVARTSEEQTVTVSVADDLYLISQDVTIAAGEPRACDKDLDACIPSPIEGEPAPIAPVIESIEQSSQGIYVGDMVTLNVTVTDQDTELENLSITYSTTDGSNQVKRTTSDQLITVSVLDGTYQISEQVIIAAGSPVACDELLGDEQQLPDVCLPVGDIPDPSDRLIDPIEGGEVYAWVLTKEDIDGNDITSTYKYKNYQSDEASYQLFDFDIPVSVIEKKVSEQATHVSFSDLSGEENYTNQQLTVTSGYKYVSSDITYLDNLNQELTAETTVVLENSGYFELSGQVINGKGKVKTELPLCSGHIADSHSEVICTNNIEMSEIQLDTIKQLFANPDNIVQSMQANIARRIWASFPSLTPGVTDNFDSYSVGDQIDIANSVYDTHGVDAETSLADIVVLTDATHYQGDQALYLLDESPDQKPFVSRAFLNGTADNGTVAVSVYVPSKSDVESSYLYLGTKNSPSSSSRFADLRFNSKSNSILLRDASGTKDIKIGKYENDKWIDVAITWKQDINSSEYYVTLTIDGTDYQSYIDEEGVEQPFIAENDTGAPTFFGMFVGNNSTTGAHAYFDNLASALFDEDSLEPIYIEDDFNSYQTGQQIDKANEAYFTKYLDEAEGNLAIISDLHQDTENVEDYSLYVQNFSTDSKPIVSRSLESGYAKSGSITISAYMPVDGYNGEATTLYLGTSSTGANSGRFAQVHLGNRQVRFMGLDNQQGIITTFVQDTWLEIVISWSPSINNEGEFDIVVTVDGIRFNTYVDSNGQEVPMIASNLDGMPTHFTILAGIVSVGETYSYFDDLKIEVNPKTDN